jgi:y4mF family transcriptional regulator
MNNYSMGSIIRLHRKAAGLTQIELAQLAGIGKTSVFDIEKGKKTVQWETILKICKVLEININFNSRYLTNLSINEKS